MPEVHEVRLIQPVEVVRNFYGALDAHEPDRVQVLVDDLFDNDVVVEFPPSLPYGGRVQGAGRLGRMFAALASGTAGIGPRSIHVQDVLATPEQAVALLTFDWFAAGSDDPIATSACEVWTFRNNKVISIRAYYWDTAALVVRP